MRGGEIGELFLDIIEFYSNAHSLRTLATLAAQVKPRFKSRNPTNLQERTRHNKQAEQRKTFPNREEPAT